jgi:hypothetical protein
LRSLTRAVLILSIALPAAVILLLAGYIVETFPAEDGYELSNGELVGGDFIAFYVGGHLYRTDANRLYDLDHQREVRALILGEAAPLLDAELPFAYPPLVAASVAPLSKLPFQTAYLLWTVVGLLGSLATLLLLLHTAGATKILPLPLLIFIAVGFVPYSTNTFLGGQASWFGIVVLGLVCSAIVRDHDFLAGAALSLSYYKPPLFIVFLIVLLFARSKRLLVGFIIGAILLTIGTILAVGVSGSLSFLATASTYTYGQEIFANVQLPADQGMGLVAMAFSLLGSLPLALVVLGPLAAISGWVAYRLLRTGEASDVLFGLFLSAAISLAFSVQLINYDLALLLVPMGLAVAWHGRSPVGSARTLVLIPLAAFYVEFLVRQFSLGHVTLNGSSLLFLMLVTSLTWYGWCRVRSCGSSEMAAAVNSCGR